MQEQKSFYIGITGVMGSGKSMVGHILAQAGVSVLDADQVVHQLYESPKVIRRLIEHFGPRICDKTNPGKISRSALAQQVFGMENGPQKLWLEQFIHPMVRQKTEDFLHSGEGVKAVLVPLLFESDSAHLYDVVWVVTIKDETVLLQRIKNRNPTWTDDEIKMRFKGQWSQAEKIKHATANIDNSGLPEETEKAVLTLLQKTLPQHLLKALK